MSEAKEKANFFLYVLLIILMVLAFYSIFNAGNPNSLLRGFIKDPSWDIPFTFFLGAGILVISLLLTRKKEQNPINILLSNNKDYILKLKSKGRSDVEITESFLKELKIRNPFSKRIIRKKTLKYLEQLDESSG